MNAGAISLVGQRDLEAKIAQMTAIVEKLSSAGLNTLGGSRPTTIGSSPNPAPAPAVAPSPPPPAPPAPSPSPSPAPAAPTPAPRPAAPAVSRVVNVYINGKATPIGVSSQADSDALVSVLRALETAKGTASGG